MSIAKTGSMLRAALLAAVLAAAGAVSPAIASDNATTGNVGTGEADQGKAAPGKAASGKSAGDKAGGAGSKAQPRKTQSKNAEKTDAKKKAQEQAKTATPAHCSGLQGLPLAQCQKCDVPGKGDTMRFLCRQGVAATYCVKNALKGDDPDCRANEPANRQNL
ncbi:MAG TPA: hypothetical protein PKA20_12650 [Burkholderiaceae bacterium]|nr:hypothetical protein [Burkholderiaceae bacterium]